MPAEAGLVGWPAESWERDEGPVASAAPGASCSRAALCMCGSRLLRSGRPDLPSDSGTQHAHFQREPIHRRLNQTACGAAKLASRLGRRMTNAAARQLSSLHKGCCSGLGCCSYTGSLGQEMKAPIIVLVKYNNSPAKLIGACRSRARGKTGGTRDAAWVARRVVQTSGWNGSPRARHQGRRR